MARAMEMLTGGDAPGVDASPFFPPAALSVPSTTSSSSSSSGLCATSAGALLAAAAQPLAAKKRLAGVGLAAAQRKPLGAVSGSVLNGATSVAMEQQQAVVGSSASAPSCSGPSPLPRCTPAAAAPPAPLCALPSLSQWAREEAASTFPGGCVIGIYC
jgi:hypothetical protein